MKRKLISLMLALAVTIFAILGMTSASGLYDAKDQMNDDILLVAIENSDYISINMIYTMEDASDLDWAIAKEAITKDASKYMAEGIGLIFNGEVTEYNIEFEDRTKAIIGNFRVNKNATDLVIKTIPGKYTNYLPLYFDYLKITVPLNTYFHSASPGPNEFSDTILIYKEYDWDPTIVIAYGEGEKEITFDNERIRSRLHLEYPKAIGTLGTTGLPIENISLYGRNNYSKYLIPGYEMYIGNDPVPGTGKTASQIGEMYKPYFVYGGEFPPSTNCPDEVYYRVIHGWDPYANRNAYLLMFYCYYYEQCCYGKNHENDAEQIYIWVDSIGSTPYRIAYDRWTLLHIHFHQVHKTYWSASGHYEGYEMDPVYTQHAGYYPQGFMTFSQEDKELDVRTMSDISFSGNHPLIRIPYCYHTFDWQVDDYDGNCSNIYALYALSDNILSYWYNHTEDCDISCICYFGYCEFAADVSDPFHGLFWEDPNVCNPIFPTLSATVDSALVNNGVLTLNVSVLYDNTEAGGSSGNDLRGLWQDRFNASLNGDQIGNPYSLNEYEAGRYTLGFDVSGISPGTYTLALNVTDNLDYNFSVDLETVIIQNQPPTASFTYSPENPIVNQTITFNASDSSDPDGGNITKYEWEFGDGNIANTTEAIITHSYSEARDYIVNLTVEDDEGTQNTTSKTIIAHPQAIFDTETPANPYPSIFGIHNGTITPNQTINVSMLYTYSCAGTGGHTEYARIWNSSWDGAEAHWNGYKGDWHNISFNRTFVLYENETYNYTLRTGSYPQIIHESSFNATGGTITCDKFSDTNGRIHYDWIPAIRLE